MEREERWGGRTTREEAWATVRIALSLAGSTPDGLLRPEAPRLSEDKNRTLLA